MLINLLKIVMIIGKQSNMININSVLMELCADSLYINVDIY